MQGDDQAGHAVAGVSLDVFGGHIHRSPAGVFQRAGVPAHLGDPHTVAVSGLLFPDLGPQTGPRRIGGLGPAGWPLASSASPSVAAPSADYLRGSLTCGLALSLHRSSRYGHC